ncbi:hypothetical protein Tco_0749230 [Tanacetum coccineum]|uniref:Uncharacterized protein n=1 Tax=Tanacetum coccineum TaxID=301880 RepID=A0ABQ4YXT7_9ASTR
MAALVISISSDLSDESVGSSFPRVLLIGSIFVEVLVAPEVGAAVVASPAKVLELDTHSSLKLDTEMSERHVSPTPYDAMLTRWRSRVASRSSSPTNSTPEIPTAPIPPAPSAVVAPSIDIISLDIPIGRLYRTYPGRPYRALIVKKSVRPLPSHRLALRYTSHHLDHFTSGSSSDHSSSGHSTSDHSSSNHSSLDYSSSGHSTSSHSSSGHTPPVTTIVCPIIYHVSTDDILLSAGDSSSESSARPSHKRCRSPVATITSSIHASRALVPSRVDLLPPRKMFRDSISPKDSVEEDIDTDVLADIEANATTVKVVADMDVEAGVDAGISVEVESNDRGTMGVGVDVVSGIDIPDGMLMPNGIERLEQVEEVVQEIYRHVMGIPL